LLGFYDQFITSIDDLISGSNSKRKEALFFLVKLGIGWVCGFVMAVLILSSVFESHIYAVSSLFIGFIIFAIPIVAKEEKETLSSNKMCFPFVILGIAIVSAITYFNPVSGGDGVDLGHLTVKLGIFVFVAGMIAISAMVLPGISGSTLLLIMGLYLPIVTAIKDILHLDLSAFPTVFLFGCGVLVGVFSVVKLIRKALENFRGQTMYTIIGLMIGSIYAVIMGPSTLDIPQPPMTLQTFSIIFFIIGGAVIVGLQLLKDKS
jgi:putative membrane protein